MKVYIEPRLDPWVSWHIRLQQLDKHNIFTPNIGEADTFLVDLKCDQYPDRIGIKGWFYANDEITIKDHRAVLDGMNDWKLLVPTKKLYDWCICEGLNASRIIIWEPPVRYNRSIAVKPWLNTDFMVVTNGSKYRDNLAEVVKAFLEFSIGDDDTMVNGKNVLKIFSAQECPIKPFNNIQFWGMQSNVVLHRELLKSKVVICPYEGLGKSSILEEAKLHGILCLTKINLDGDVLYTPENLTKTLTSVFEYDEMQYTNCLQYTQDLPLINGSLCEDSYNKLINILKNN